MRMSELLGETLRKRPAEAETAGHQLLLRAAYIRPVAPGLFSYLPLGLRSLRKIEAILREEMHGINAQEIVMPLIQPGQPGAESGRLEGGGKERVRFRDRGGRDWVIGAGQEEVAAQLARASVRSYRQLPVVLYQIATTFRDEPRPRGGLLRAREFTLLASYSFDRDGAGLEARFRDHRDAYRRIFRRVGLDDVLEADGETGAGEAGGLEFMLPLPVGDDSIAVCRACGYAANQRAARIGKPVPGAEAPKPLDKVSTPGTDTIASLAEFLGVPVERTAKVVFFAATVPTSTGRERKSTEIVVLALVRGDMEVSESKLRAAIAAQRLRPAEAAAIRAVGAEPGYASPVGLDSDDLVVVVDDLAAASPNLIGGANEEGFHYRHVNFGRDYRADVVTDIAAAVAGSACPECKARLDIQPCLEVGSLHRFEASFTANLEATYQDEDGRVRPFAMGSYGIGLERLLGCIAEIHRDERGLRLPPSVAPFDLYFAAITGGDPDLAEQAEALYAAARAAGTEVLYDDRDVSPGVKFNDADLIGIPLRATLGARSLEAGGLELKRREQSEKNIVPIAGAAQRIAELTAALRSSDT